MAAWTPRAMTDAVLQRLLATTGPRPRIAIAYSGGLDSTVLAHMLVLRRRQLGALRSIHVDHGLHADSGKWSARCRRQARDWQVPFVSEQVEVKALRGESLEAAARAARYGALARLIAPGEVLVTAQHRDDQVET